MTSERVYVDFLKRDFADRVLLTPVGTQRDLERLGITLTVGLELRVYSDDSDDNGNDDPLVAEGTVERDEDFERWVLRLKSGVRHVSDSST